MPAKGDSQGKNRAFRAISDGWAKNFQKNQKNSILLSTFGA
jgi:hypothetical protein